MVDNLGAKRWQVSDSLWAKIEPLLPRHENTHPRGGGRKPTPNRSAMNGVLFVLRTGSQWKSLDATGICAGSVAHRKFQEWCAAGVFLELWKIALLEYDELKGIDWTWQAMDGAMTKAPLGGEKYRSQSYRPRQRGLQAQLAV